MTNPSEKKASAYDKYINYKRFSIAVAAFFILILIPVPDSMRDVGVEYSMGKTYVLDYITHELFDKSIDDVEQWQALTAQVMEGCMRQGALTKDVLLKRNLRSLKNIGIETSRALFDRHYSFLEGLDETKVTKIMTHARDLRHEKLTYNMLNDDQKKKADQAATHIHVCIAMVAFVVICFITEAMPLPGVAFCIGLILVFSGIVTRQEVAPLFWSDACWFIMGSLMFAVAFVKTGVDKRICLLIFRSLAKPSIGWITLVLIIVIAPSASFISDHALAAIFLPIAMILYNNSLGGTHGEDRELVKMLMITIAMACNIGGFGAPSGGARNVIMMTYMEDMFGITMGYGQWILYGLPFVLIMIPIVWITVNKRFKPKIRNLGPALETLKTDISRMGGWNRKQIIALVIFTLMLFCWITEKNLLLNLIGFRLGIGVIAVAGAVAYLLAGVVNWRDYQEKVDWGVVWLYAGAIIFGRTLDSTGTAYWMARAVVEGLASIGLDSGMALLAAGSCVTAVMTNLMADGPAAASVGPITLNMAAVSNPGTTLIPFMGLATACASSFAYLLVIGTPPNAIVYSSGYLDAKDFLRVGIICFFAALVVLLLLSIFYWPLLGFSGMPAA
ncbi:MAG: DASS family sodium-coupled anion symporter [Candidatus Electryonea clarkiae]|nr:DASS family sodium-coupled anion symporter [Candidatus Electryonea clarkiae]